MDGPTEIVSASGSNLRALSSPKQILPQKTTGARRFLCASFVVLIEPGFAAIAFRNWQPESSASAYINIKRKNTMRFMILVKANQDSEAGVMPSEKLLAEMGKFNEELVKAGIMLAGEGLHPSSKGARVRFSGNKRTVIDGPFTETKELIAGYWLWQVRSLEEAIEWVKRCPNPTNGEPEIEIRQVFEADDFGKEFTPELRAQEERLRSQLGAKNSRK
jgi:hypothetical protein